VLPKGLREDFEVVLARDGVDALTLFVRETPDLLLLGMSLDEPSAFEICRALRTYSCPQPVFLLTTSFDPAERARGHFLGSLEYIDQPLLIREVRERLRAAARRVEYGSALLPGLEEIGGLIRAARGRVLSLEAFHDRLAEACENVVRLGTALGVVRIRWDCGTDSGSAEFMRAELDRITRAEDLVTLAGDNEAVLVLPAEGRSGTIGFLRRLRRRWESLDGAFRATTLPQGIRVGVGVVLPARDLRPPTPVAVLATAVATQDLFENPIFMPERTGVVPSSPPLADGTYGP